MWRRCTTNSRSSPAFGKLRSRIAPGIVGTMALIGLALFFCIRLARPERPLELRPSRIAPLGRWRVPLAVCLAAALIALAGVPLSNLLYKAGVIVVQAGEHRVRSWSAGKCLEMVFFAPVRFQREFHWTLLIGSLAATAASAAAIPLAWAARRSRWRTAAVMLAAIACLVVPGTFLGLAIIGLLNRPNIPWLIWLYDHSILAPWLAQTIRALGPAVLVMWYAVRTIPQALLDSAATEGCGPLGQLWHIVLPQRWSALAVAWLIGLALALGDLTATSLVVPPGVETLSMHIFNLVHFNVEDRVAGICLALIILFGLVAAAVAWLGKRSL